MLFILIQWCKGLEKISEYDKKIREFLLENIVNEGFQQDMKKSVSKWIKFSEKNAPQDIKQAIDIFNSYLNDMVKDKQTLDDMEEFMGDFLVTDAWENWFDNTDIDQDIIDKACEFFRDNMDDYFDL